MRGQQHYISLHAFIIIEHDPIISVVKSITSHWSDVREYNNSNSICLIKWAIN